jgi:hypothetical protein
VRYPVDGNVVDGWSEGARNTVVDGLVGVCAALGIHGCALEADPHLLRGDACVVNRHPRLAVEQYVIVLEPMITAYECQPLMFELLRRFEALCPAGMLAAEERLTTRSSLMVAALANHARERTEPDIFDVPLGISCFSRYIPAWGTGRFCWFGPRVWEVTCRLKCLSAFQPTERLKFCRQLSDL